jgi:SAM-dependent methyltransferase
LNGLPNYVPSEYFSDVPLGTFHEGIRCEDLQNLSFSDETFDLMISEDVLEHVRNPDSALREVYRILKPDGLFVFTVPIYGEQTVVRVDTSTDEDIHLLPSFYHGDPLRQEGALAYNDFGRDIVDRCRAIGLQTHHVEFEAADRRFLVGDVFLTKKVAF